MIRMNLRQRVAATGSILCSPCLLALLYPPQLSIHTLGNSCLGAFALASVPAWNIRKALHLAPGTWSGLPPRSCHVGIPSHLI